MKLSVSAGRASAAALSLALVFSAVSVPASAAAKMTLSLDSATMRVGKTKVIRVIKVKKKNVKSLTVKSSKSSVASAKVKAPRKFSVTAKKAGSAVITATVKLNKLIGGKKKYSLKFTANVKADQAVTPEPEQTPTVVTPTSTPVPTPVTDPVIISVSQSAANIVILGFNGNASAKAKKTDIFINAQDGSTSTPLNKLTFAADGMSAEAVLSANLTDKKAYNASYKNISVPFVASVGPVVGAQIITTEAEQNAATPIKFRLLDANKIDVTAASSVNTTVILDVTGSYSNKSIDKPASATVTMRNIGDVCTVNLKYNTNAPGSADVTASGNISCVAPKPRVGTPVFYQGTEINRESNCAKFYNGLSSKEVRVSAGENTDVDSKPTVFFYAKDTDGSAIEYDSYTATSSNPDIAQVSTVSAAGKFASFTVTGNKAGSANISVQAVKNGAAASYLIPVTVTSDGAVANIDLVLSRTEMSNALDSNYYGLVEVRAYDSAGVRISDGQLDINYSVVDASSKAGTSNLDSDAVKGLDNSPDLTGFIINANKYTAYGAAAGTYTIQVDVSTSSTDRVVTKRQNVTVRSLPANAWVGNSGSGANVSYAIELEKDTLDEAVADEHETDVRLYATCGSLFAGYVDTEGNIGKIGDYGSGNTGAVVANSATSIAGISAYVNYGSNYTGDQDAPDKNGYVTVPLYNAAINLRGAGSSSNYVYTPNINSTRMTLRVVDDKTAGKYYCGSDIKLDTYFAKTGTYTVTYTFAMNGRQTSINNALTVKNTLKAPEVDISGRYVDTLNESGIMKVLSTNVDLNNQTANASIREAGIKALSLNNDGTLGITDATDSGGSITVNYVAVEEDDIIFYVPINATFTRQ